jgi:cation:H+ antiporter
MATDLLLLVLSIAVLVTGAEILVRGATRLALRIGISPFVVGLTVVGFGTSAPELAASIASARSGHAEIAVGNVIGSNIMNVALVLGLTAMIMPIPVSRTVVQREVGITLAASFVPYAALLNGGLIGRGLGAAMVASLGVFLGWTFLESRRDPSLPIEVEEPETPRHSGLLRTVADLGLVAFGIAMLVFGAGMLVDSASAIARTLGVSELVIGLTIVAGGTSAPELATSLVAVWRGRSDLGVGNILGSCVFNLLGILGITAIVTPIEVPREVFIFDLPIMILTAVACLPIMFTGHRINRWEGVLLTAGFVVYTVMLFAGWPFPADRGASAPDAVTTSMVVPVEPDDYRTAASIQAPPSTSSPS